MKIGLLAPEYNGKSSYLVALYAVLVEEKSADTGYPINIYVKDPVQRRWFSDSFANLIDDSLPLEDRFPLKNAKKITEYAFVLEDKNSHTSQEVIFVDFAGELLRGAESDEDARLSHNLEKALLSCDAFIVVLDVDFLANKSKWMMKSKSGSSDISRIILESIKISFDKEYGKYGVPIAFCVSKIDKILNKENSENSIKRSFDSLKDIFAELFLPKFKHPTMVCGVTLGESISIGADGHGGDFDPINIETPFEFCLTMWAYAANKFHIEKEAQFQNEAIVSKNKYEKVKNMGIFDKIDQWFEVGAEIGQSASEKCKADSDTAALKRNAEGIKAKKYYDLSYKMVAQLSTEEKSSMSAIFLSGKKWEIKTKFDMGELPIRTIEV